jgi:hypothetical protein
MINEKEPVLKAFACDRQLFSISNPSRFVIISFETITTKWRNSNDTSTKAGSSVTYAQSFNKRFFSLELLKSSVQSNGRWEK